MEGLGVEAEVKTKHEAWMQGVAEICSMLRIAGFEKTVYLCIVVGTLTAVVDSPNFIADGLGKCSYK